VHQDPSNLPLLDTTLALEYTSETGLVLTQTAQ
jgi:hypothetical protein